MVPLYGFVRGDTLGVVVLAQDGDTIAEVAARLQAAVAMRVRPRARVRLLAGGRALDPEATVAAAGLGPLDRVDLVPEAG